MELLLMLLIPLPIGLFVKNRVVGFLAYVAVHGFAFTFQTMYLILGWVGRDTTAFGSYPHADSTSILSYGAVNAAIFGVGLGLVALGQRLAARRAARPGRCEPLVASTKARP